MFENNVYKIRYNWTVSKTKVQFVEPILKNDLKHGLQYSQTHI